MIETEHSIFSDLPLVYSSQDQELGLAVATLHALVELNGHSSQDQEMGLAVATLHALVELNGHSMQSRPRDRIGCGNLM